MTALQPLSTVPMPKNKRPVPRKSHNPAVEDNDVLAGQLAELALALSEQEHGEPEDEAALHLQQEEFTRMLRNALRKKNDEVLYGAIEHARDTDVGAYQYLRSHIEEAAATLVLRKEGAPAMEVNAFAVPFFVHSHGGLKEGEGFQDGDAFGALVDSFKAGGLESAQAKVVLIAHAFDAEEAARISYSQLGEMARDAAAAMSDKRLAAAPALEAAIAGWAPTSFGAADKAVELRFLLGFALKREDDPFYQVPADEAAADAWFEARMARYRAWTDTAAPLIKRCLAARADALDLHFLYQDLFFGAREQGMAELAMLQMMAQLGAGLEGAGEGARAVVGPADDGQAMVLRVDLRDAGGALLATSSKPLDLAADLQDEVDDICDALATLGVTQVSVALRFGADGQPQEESPYTSA
jgi:hypothetical protein